ncbi:hypothetical protein DICVIV_08467 [Dictyocaulus viviparus]|uniref:Uncharacterized protein n=1 Tax=Dictyocaulus viviparus TaxID=29172 RepID=A0A0D8XNW4_DICVI|nr:hypothetical protein DICVIV_08467 [Dictyocaulus viviparus]
MQMFCLAIILFLNVLICRRNFMAAKLVLCYEGWLDNFTSVQCPEIVQECYSVSCNRRTVGPVESRGCGRSEHHLMWDCPELLAGCEDEQKCFICKSDLCNAAFQSSN